MVRRFLILFFGSILFSQPAVITKASVSHLPVPVQKFLIDTKTVGKQPVKQASLVQSGAMKMKPGSAWVDLDADQKFDLEQMSFSWKGTITMPPLLKVTAVDRYDDGVGSLKIKLWSFIPLGTETGEEVSKAELMRYLSELIWCPSGFLSDSISWESVNDSTVLATITDGGLKASGQFIFPENGMVRFRAPRMAEIDRGNPKLETWETITTAYREVNGYILPSEGVALYHLAEGPYEYIRVKIDRIDFTY